MTFFVISCFVILVIGVLMGLARGTGKSVIRLITLVLAVVATFFVSVPAANYLANKDISGLVSEIDGVEVTTASETLVNLLKSNETAAELLGENSTLEAAARQLPVMLFAVVTFIICFLLLCLVSLLVYALFRWPLLRLAGKDRYDRPTAGSRAGGAIVGFVSAILFIGILLTPVLGVANMLKNLPEDTEIQAKEDYFDPVAENAMVKVFNTMGFGYLGDMLMKKASKITAEDGTEAYVSEDIDSIVRVYSLLDEYGIVEKMQNEDMEFSEFLEYFKDEEFVNRLFALMLDSKILSDTFKAASAKGGEMVAEALRLPKNDAEGYNLVTDSVASTIEGSSDEIELAGAYSSYTSESATVLPQSESPVADAEVDYAPSDLTKFTVKGSDTVYCLFTENGETHIGIMNGSEIAKSLSVSDAVKKVEDVRNRIVEKLTKSVNTGNMNALQKEEFEAAINSSVDKMMAEAASEIMKSSGYDAKKVAEFFAGSENEAEQLRFENFSYNGVKADGFAKAFENSITALLESESEDAAETLASIVVPAMQIVDSLSGTEEGGTQFAYVAPAVGQLVGAIHGSESLNGLGLTLLNAISESSVVNEVVPDTVTEEIIKIYTEGGDVTNTAIALASSANIAAALSSGDVDTVEKLIRDLTVSLNDETAAQIQSLVTDEFMANFVSDAEFAANAKTISAAIVDVLSGAKGKASYRTEAEALVSAYGLVMSSSDFSSDDLVSLLRYSEKSEIIASIIHKCSGCRVDFSASMKREFRNTMTSAFDTSTEQKSVIVPLYNDIAAILGLDISWSV
ncbi:MAG: CvpA family protein [Clostridia bacterium]|nr:CvpA family protein [Clostridia bacterium]